MRFFVGTSGFSYKEWKGSFYPDKLPQKQMLSYYAKQFDSCEINGTFKKLPTEAVVEAWAAQVPKSFRFALKARQIITHFKRLNGTESQTDDFLRVASVLQKRLGPILFQLPPNFKKDVPRLDAFLRYFDSRAKAAFEFRHESWFDDDTFDCLRAHSAALCVADGENLPDIDFVPTTNWGYVRLRHEKYTAKRLGDWIQRMKSQGWREAYVYFKHEDAAAGPKLAARFVELAD